MCWPGLAFASKKDLQLGQVPSVFRTTRTLQCGHFSNCIGRSPNGLVWPARTLHPLTPAAIRVTVSESPRPDQAWCPTGNDAGAVAVAVTSSTGTDIVISMTNPKPLGVRLGETEIVTDGHLPAILLGVDAKPTWAGLAESTQLTAPDVQLNLPVDTFQGELVDARSQPGESYFTVAGEFPDSDAVGQTFFAIDERFRRAYTIAAVERSGLVTRVFTKREGRGFEAQPAKRFEIPAVAVFAAP